MAVDHHVGLRLGQVLRRLAALRFLREDTHSSAWEILDQPSVVHVEACIAFTAPAMPANTTRLAFGRCHVLQNHCFHRKAEGLEVEARTPLQLRTLAAAETDLRRIRIIGWPERSLTEEWPDIRCAQSSNDNLV